MEVALFEERMFLEREGCLFTAVDGGLLCRRVSEAV